MPVPILQIAVPAPLFGCLDYLPPAGCDPTRLRPGQRLRVPFGRQKKVGILLGLAEHSELPRERLRPALALLDEAPLLPDDILALVRWAADYYHHPLGEAFNAALPALLRQGTPAEPRLAARWELTAEGAAVDLASLRRAPRQAALLARLAAHPGGMTRESLQDGGAPVDAVLRALLAKGWVRRTTPSPRETPAAEAAPPPTLHQEQQAAVSAITKALGGFQGLLLEGVTGSGKTEVYLRAMQTTLERGRQVLLLVPEIGLTPQLVERLEARLGQPVTVLHSALGDRERLNAWLAAARGEAGVVIGTRSAVFTPLARPGLFIVDEEHDASLKQQEGFRYSARDLLVWRARHLGVPIVLGSATPSLESLHNATTGRYRHLSLRERAGGALPPRIGLVDLRGQPLDEGLSRPLLARMREHLAEDGQVLLFLNRRGFAPALLCHECGWVAACRRCDAHLTLHQAAGRLHCHHCDARQPIPAQCPDCGSADLRALGAGTERIEAVLRRHFPEQPLVRIDRDTTRRRGSLAESLERARSGEARILLGTQMLAKGHHFPALTLVGVLESDQGLYSSDFRAGERMAQLIVQVAGRAGRGDRPGEVLIQTHHPEHPLLLQLVDGGYPAFASAALAERRAAALPPFSFLALLRAEAPRPEAARDFLQAAHDAAVALEPIGVAFWGPVPAPMERRAGRFRAQLMLQAETRGDLHRLLGRWIPRLETIEGARRVRWSLDVDPSDTY
ncbi:primosomal protein N' [Thiohalobacter sp. IOR34]|uniref:primosomal protein N' n=1 Tax=Thiohalobacter sp. IOR34 TaxID=3057176 RepID=UPI0025AFEF33|nr:primosomal protein N' [Thiohalobacter sp. IOR34]WJW75668.1 primosomal protein N' [Thiohalobacter sp. IOR34]